MDIWWLVWVIKWAIYVLFWTWPWYYVTWPLTIITIVSARGEYKRTGGGIRGIFHSIWFAAKTLPSTSNALARFLVSQLILLYALLTRTDAMAHVPGPIRTWLGHSGGETQVVEKIVEREKIVYRDRYSPSIKSRILLRARWMIVGALVLLAVQNWQMLYLYVSKLAS